MPPIQIVSMFEPVDPPSLSPERRKFYYMLPEDYRAFLGKTNGSRVAPHSLSFFTGIPFDPPSEHLPSRTDFVETFLGLPPVDGEDHEDILYYNEEVAPDYFPEGLILVARGHYGDLAISIAPEDQGVVYYQWRHFPSVASHYREKRARLAEAFADPASPEASKADELALLERLAGSWTEFMAGFIPEESMELPQVTGLEIMRYEKMYEQIKRRVAYHNVALMLGPDYRGEGLRLLKQISAGFLPAYWEEEIKAEAPGSGEIYVAGKSLEDNWILDRMLDALMLNSPPDPGQMAILVHFGQFVGYPVLEIKRSIADYHGRRERDAKRQAPPLTEVLQNGREQALRTIQTLYLIGIAGGEVTPNQDRMFAEIATKGGLQAEELHFIVRHREGLGLMPPLFKAWADEMQQKVAQFLRLDGEPKPESQARADLFFELIGQGITG